MNMFKSLKIYDNILELTNRAEEASIRFENKEITLFEYRVLIRGILTELEENSRKNNEMELLKRLVKSLVSSST